MRKKVHVVPKGDDWAIRKENSQRVTKVTKTQKEAIEIAKEIAKNSETELFIHGKNGQIRERNSYGNDPNPPKG